MSCIAQPPVKHHSLQLLARIHGSALQVPTALEIGSALWRWKLCKWIGFWGILIWGSQVPAYVYLIVHVSCLVTPSGPSRMMYKSLGFATKQWNQTKLSKPLIPTWWHRMLRGVGRRDLRDHPFAWQRGDRQVGRGSLGGTGHRSGGEHGIRRSSAEAAAKQWKAWCL